MSGFLRFLSAFSDTGSFTTQVTQVVELRTTYTATACQFDSFEFRGMYRECTFNTYAVRNFANCECFGNSTAATFDYDTFENLDTLAGTLYDTDVNTDVVSGPEIRQVSFKLVLRQFID